MSILAWKLKTVKPILDIGSIATYDLVSRGKDETNKNQCYGEAESEKGWGPGFQYACIHSDSTEYSGGNTVWYNYTIASADTIIDENTDSDHPATNTATATESICPKGWTLPTVTQTRTIGPNSGSTTYISILSPVLGGDYMIGELKREDKYGYFWNSTAASGSALKRNDLYYDGSILSNASKSRHSGAYIRCVQAS